MIIKLKLQSSCWLLWLFDLGVYQSLSPGTASKGDVWEAQGAKAAGAGGYGSNPEEFGKVSPKVLKSSIIGFPKLSVVPSLPRVDLCISLSYIDRVLSNYLF